MIRDDIVERLRDINISWSDSGELAAAAADEIERLREELKTEHALSFRDQVFMLEERLAEFTAERNRAWGQAHWTEYERSIARAEREACAAVLERGVEAPRKETTMWENLDKSRPDSAHYSVMRVAPHAEGMDALLAMFPDGEANDLNFVLFSTSGVHGTYHAIEEAERFMNGEDPEGHGEVTFLVVHPRLVALRHGVCHPRTQGDIDYLKRLRASSHAVAATIGAYTPPNVELTGLRDSAGPG